MKHLHTAIETFRPNVGDAAGISLPLSQLKLEVGGVSAAENTSG